MTEKPASWKRRPPTPELAGMTLRALMNGQTCKQRRNADTGQRNIGFVSDDCLSDETKMNFARRASNEREKFLSEPVRIGDTSRGIV